MMRTPNIDFKRMRGENDQGRREEFENFVTYLARHEPPGDGWEFTRLDGRGGDGGVEAYWQNDALSQKIGYQAKYFTTLSDNRWRQIDKSVKTALDNHNDLTKYVIAIACNLTGKTARRGKSGIKKWEEHKRKWEGWAKEKKMKVVFVRWAADDMATRLVDENRQGMIKYWFDETFLTPAWFDERIQQVCQDLGERYSPTTHTDTRVSEQLSLFLKKNTKEEQELAELRKRFLSTYHKTIEPMLHETPPEIDHTNLTNSTNALRKLALWSKNCFEKFPIDEWRETTEALNTENSKLHNQLLEPGQYLATMSEKERDRVNHGIEDYRYQLGKLCHLCNKTNLDAINANCFYLSGNAGIGKSHALGHLAKTEIAEGRAVVMLLGQFFDGTDPTTQIPERLGFRDISFDDFLSVLDIAACNSGKIGLLIIDALNEGKGLEVWPDHIASLGNCIKNYPHLKLIVSCRREYEGRIWGTIQETPHWHRHNLPPLSPVEQDKFCQAITTRRGLVVPPHLRDLPIMRNPLFLMAICKSLKEREEARFPEGLDGAANIFNYFLDAACNKIIKENNIHQDHHGEIRAVHQALAKLMARNQSLGISRDCFLTIADKTVTIPPPSGRSWLDIFLDSGLLRSSGKTPGEGLLHYSFQALEEFMVAEEIYRRAHSKWGKASRLVRFLTCCPPLELNISWTRKWHIPHPRMRISINYTQQDVAGALWAIIAERDGIELFDLAPQWLQRIAPPLWRFGFPEIFIDSLSWRSPKSITERTSVLLNQFGKHMDHAQPFRIALQFASVPNHRWNADRLHSNLIRFESLAKRDSFWTVEILNDLFSYETSSNERYLLDTQIEKDIQPDNPELVETYRLTAIVLAWFCSSTTQEMRDGATKKMAEIFYHYPQLMCPVLNKFREVNDPYVLERLLAAIYGAACRLTDDTTIRSVAEVVYDTIFVDNCPPYHILLRDYARGIIERAEYLNALPEGIDLKRCRPPYKSQWPLPKHTNAEIDALAKDCGDEYLAIARSCRPPYGDFGRYTLESKVDNFIRIKLTHAPPTDSPLTHRFDGEMIGNWVAHRVYEYYGWRGCLFSHDRNRRYYGYDNRERARTERVGKKYQWIAMYELLGILADNVWMESQTEWGKYVHFDSAFDVNFVRDIDPTIFDRPQPSESTTLDRVRMRLPNVSPLGKKQDLLNWVFTSLPEMDAKRHAIVTDDSGVDWYRLYAFTSDDHTIKDNETIYPRMWGRLSAICLPEKHLTKMRVAMCDETLKHTNPSFSLYKEPHILHSQVLVGEYDWRGKIPDSLQETYGTEEIHYQLPAVEIRWENKVDGLSDTTSILLPDKRLYDSLGLRQDATKFNQVLDASGNIGAYSMPEHDQRANEADYWQVLLIRKDLFDKYLHKKGLGCIWIFGGERSFHSSSDDLRRRSFSSVAWLRGNTLTSKSWYLDTPDRAGM